MSLSISSRGYMYIRSMSIQNVADALVELITNSDDAFQNKFAAMEKAGTRSSWVSRHAGDIEVEFWAPNVIKVRDHATGMDGATMVTNLLNVGDYTAAGDLSRGHFSRGAKDISALGDVTFMMVKNNLYSACKINYDTTVEITCQV